jgi:CRP-like cAMP-binding protein
MHTKTDNTICTDVEWLGRAHCDKCHIRRLMMFSELPDSAFENLLQPIDHFLYSSGAVIYEAGSQKNFIYSIRRGMVKLAHITQNGDYRIVRLLGPGSVIGLELLDGSDNYHHTAVAIGQVDLCKIPVPTIRQLESSYSGLYEKVVEQLQKQLNLADQWIVTLGTGTAKQRVAQLLLILNEFYADKDGDFILLNREDMAAMIGTSTETVSRMIAEFKRENILTKTHNRLHKCNIEALQQITSQRRTLRDPSPQ